MGDGDFQGATVEVIEPLTRVTTVVHTVGVAPVVSDSTVDRFVVRATMGHSCSGHRLVTTDDSGLLVYADHDDMSQINRRVYLVENAWTLGDLATAVAIGPVFESGWAWEQERAIFVGAYGHLTQIPPTTGYLRKVAVVAEVQSIWFDPQPAIVLT